MSGISPPRACVGYQPRVRPGEPGSVAENVGSLSLSPERFRGTLPDDMKPPLRVAMFAYPDTQILDVVGPLEVFGRTTRWLRDHGPSGPDAYAIEIIGLTRGAFRTSSGLRLHATRGFRDVRRGLDTLLVAG